MKAVDLIIRGALFFDGSGGYPHVRDVAVNDGRIVKIEESLGSIASNRVVDGHGQWLVPGMVDLHTHLDIELEADAHLTEVTRHGTTTIVIGNCSIGLAFGLEEIGDDRQTNSVVSCFARVENLPRSMIQSILGTALPWKDPPDYLDHLEQKELGPNVAVLLPHSLLRMRAMGMPAAVDRQATPVELDEMCSLLDRSLECGFVGLSTDALPYHFLANSTYRDKWLPPRYAGWSERKALFERVSHQNGLVQYTPDPERPINSLRLMLMSSAWFYRRPLRMTITAVVDLASSPFAHVALLAYARLVNSRLGRGRLSFQALPAPFKVIADGPMNPLMDERSGFRELNHFDADDRAGRMGLLADMAFVERFRQEWFSDSRGVSLKRAASLIGAGQGNFSCTLGEMIVESSPVQGWDGQTLEAIFHRYKDWKKLQGKSGAMDEHEGDVFELLPVLGKEEPDFFLGLLALFDRDLRWSTVSANRRPLQVKRLLWARDTLPGFSDSGAHLSNIAYYDVNLRALKIAQTQGLSYVARMVSRLTRKPAELLGVDAGRAEEGVRADLVLISPSALAAYEPEFGIEMKYSEPLGCDQLVNRPQGVVNLVVINGAIVWQDGDHKSSTPGRVLRRQQVYP